MNRRRDPLPGDDESVEELLRQVGARDAPAADVMREVRQAVHAQWRATVIERARRRRTIAWGIAASIALAVIVSAATLRFSGPGEVAVATIALIDGRPRFAASGASGVLRVGDSVMSGETLHTDERSRIALDAGAGVSVRIDRNSIVEFAAPDRFVLNAGVIYIDAGRGGDGRSELVIETRAGDVRHLGTQYQAAQRARVVEISIREGRVEVAGTGGDALASAGEQLRFLHDGSIERIAIAAHDPLWRWAARTAPLFEIDNRTLAAFLQWVARETGRSVVYRTPEAQRTAEALTLRGSISGLDPDTALAAVLSTTDLQRYDTADDIIGVALTVR